MRKIESRFNLSRPRAVFVVSAVALLTFGLLVAGVGPRAVNEARSFSTELPATVDKLTTIPLIGDVLDRVHAPEKIRTYAADLPSRLDDQAISDFIETVVGGLAAGLTVIVVGIATLSDGRFWCLESCS